MLITDPQPELLDRYYDSENYISHTDARRNFLEHLYHSIKNYSLNKKCALAKNYAGEHKSLLDIGAGTGDFLLKAKNKGWEVKGIEPNSLARSKALEKGLELHKDMEGCKDQKFELVTLWHVLEHLPDLETQIANIVSVIPKNGTLIIAVPNFKSYDARYYKKYWAAYDVPRHLWHFSRKAIPKLFSKHHMQVIKTKPMIFDAFYVSLLSEKYSRGKINYLRAFFVGLKSNLLAWKTSEYSSIIYVLKKS